MRGVLPVGLTAAGAAAVAAAGTAIGAGPAVSAPLAASFALVATNPALPSARPRTVLAGHVLAVVGGLVAVKLAAPGPLAVTIAAALALMLMLATRTLHPPAVACGCVLALQPSHHLPIAVLLLTAAVLLAAILTGCARFMARRTADARQASP
jgi:CBS-domain-containing membrane protein